MLLIFIRTLCVYLLLLALMRFMGKRQLGELQPSDLASTILISELATIPVEQTDLPLAAGLLPVAVVASLEVILSFACLHLRSLARLVSGKPVVVIRDGQIDQAALQKLRFGAADLLAALRSKDIFSPEEVSYAVIETDGTLNVCLSPAADSPTRQELGLPCPHSFRPVLPFVVNGEVLTENLLWCGLSRSWLDDWLARRRLEPEQVFLLLGNGKEEPTLIQKEKATARKR